MQLIWDGSSSSSSRERYFLEYLFSNFISRGPLCKHKIISETQCNTKINCCVTWGLGDGEVIDGLELYLQEMVRKGVSEAISDEPSVTQHGSHSSGVGHLWAWSSHTGQGSVLGAPYLPQAK